MTSKESTSRQDIERRLEAELNASLVEGKLPCAAAFKIARKLKVSPREVGDMANKLSLRIAVCQLGCFP